MDNCKRIIFAALVLVGAAIPADAQQPAPSPPPTVPYGSPIGSKRLRRQWLPLRQRL